MFRKGARPDKLWDVVDVPPASIDGVAVLAGQSPLDECVRSAVPSEQVVDDRSQRGGWLGDADEGVGVGNASTGAPKPGIEYVGAGCGSACGDERPDRP